MDAKKFLEIVHFSERLKDVTRHAYTSGGRHESVAEHSWRLCLMAFFLRDEFPDADMDKVARMCMIHDLGEIFTGDIPTFLKTKADVDIEDDTLDAWVATLPEATRQEFTALLVEMNALETQEAKIYKALDKMEAIIQHNEADLSTWLPLEYELQFTYGEENVQFSPWFREFREEINAISREKIEKSREG